MYIPRHFVHDDRADLMTVMRENAFATIVTVVDGEPLVSHVPVLARADESGAITIEGHVASANPHARSLVDGRALAIFHGPHTYISPTRYQSAGRVPTWNYIAVHAHGNARALVEPASKHAILERLIAAHEPSFAAPFAQFEDRLRDGLLGAITGFEIAVDRLEGKFKLGQHRLVDDLPSMQASHEHGSDDERAIATWMKRLGYWR